MRASAGYLTRGRVALCMRMAGLVGGLCFLGGLVLLLLPSSKQAAPHDVASAASRQAAHDALLFPKYSELTSTRMMPFKFQPLTLAEVQIRQREPEPGEEPEFPPPPPPPPPKPDTQGLTLVGTAPGKPRAFAMLHDQQTDQITTVVRNDEVRNAIVKEIHRDRIVLTMKELEPGHEEEQQTELDLAAIQGSENFDRQLQGLPPLPGQQPAAAPPTRMASRQSPSSGSPGSNSILTGAAPGGSGTQPTVITQAAIPGSQPRTPKDSKRRRDRSKRPSSTPSGQSAPRGQSTPSGQPSQSSQSTPAGQSTPSGQSSPSGQSTPAGQSTSPASQQRRSLGVSGHMLAAEKQQELGLQQTGLLITAVRNTNSPLQVGDVLLSIAGRNFANLGQAKSIIDAASSSTVQLQVFRNGSTTQVTTNLGEG